MCRATVGELYTATDVTVVEAPVVVPVIVPAVVRNIHQGHSNIMCKTCIIVFCIVFIIIMLVYTISSVIAK